jgi:hypothetical protein
MALLSFSYEPQKALPLVAKVVNDTIKAKSLGNDTLTYAEKILRTVPKNAKPILGNHFMITGDFDGDGRRDTLREHFVSMKNGGETNKFYDSLDTYDQLVALTVQKEPLSFVTSDNHRIDTLLIAAGGQVLGLSYLKNEGDLDGDGADEISYVGDRADWSSLNSCHVMSYKHHKWKEIFSFNIWDWQIPPLPQFPTIYGPFGVSDVVSTMSNDSINKKLQQDLDAFPGFIKKIKNNEIRVIYRNYAAERDTATINLRHIGKKEMEQFSF